MILESHSMILKKLKQGLIDYKQLKKLLFALDKEESKETLTEKKEEKNFKTLKIDISSADGDVVKISIE